MADIVVVLFSRESLPPRWPRAQWEDALVHEPAAEEVRIAFFKCDVCVPPRVLSHVFDRRQIRELKRWVRGRGASFEPPAEARYPDADLEWLGVSLADAPGWNGWTIPLSPSSLRALMSTISTRSWSSSAAIGAWLPWRGTAAQIGLRLEGELGENLVRLADFCAAHRFLLILDAAEGDGPEQLQFGGRCSTLISSGRWPLQPPGPLREAQSALARLTGPWDEICRQARLGRRLTREQGRMAECYELMQNWHAAAERQGDRTVLEESAREIVWILEAWGRTEEARSVDYRRANDYDDQMMLPFG